MKPALLLVATVLLCSCSGRRAITIGSKNFTESILLGEIAAQQIERKLHISVDRKLDLGGTLLAHEALLAGQIDVYPEYTGTAASNVLKESAKAEASQLYTRVRGEYLRRFHLIWMPPLGFNDTFAMVVRSREAKALREPTLSVAAKRTWRLGVGYEFLTRPDGLQNLDHTYGFTWQGTPKTMDLGLLYAALQQNQIDMAAGNSTDGLLTEERFLVLADNKKAFPPYDACYVVRENLLQEHPGVEHALAALSGRIGEDTMRELNREVDIAHRPVIEVVRNFLRNQP